MVLGDFPNLPRKCLRRKQYPHPHARRERRVQHAGQGTRHSPSALHGALCHSQPPPPNAGVGACWSVCCRETSPTERDTERTRLLRGRPHCLSSDALVHPKAEDGYGGETEKVDCRPRGEKKRGAVIWHPIGGSEPSRKPPRGRIRPNPRGAEIT